MKIAIVYKRKSMIIETNYSLVNTETGERIPSVTLDDDDIEELTDDPESDE